MTGGSMSRNTVASACSPISWPIWAATTVELRQWTPPQTRALLDSAAKSEKRVKVLDLPGNAGEETAKVNSSPNTEASTVAPAAEVLVRAAAELGDGRGGWA